MRKINKTIFSIAIVIVGIIVTFFVLYQQNKQILSRSPQDIENEVEYAQITQEEVQKKPFLSHLPIRTNNYTIIYSSINKEIVIIFKDNTISIEESKILYTSEINEQLFQIGIDPTVQKISWEVEN